MLVAWVHCGVREVNLYPYYHQIVKLRCPLRFLLWVYSQNICVISRESRVNSRLFTKVSRLFVNVTPLFATNISFTYKN